ncbi:MAG TPA: protein kinase [Acidobacteriota bacterium]
MAAFSPGTRLGSYEIISPLVLNRGLFRARELASGRATLLLLIESGRLGDPVRRARFEREVEALRGLEHPCLCRVLNSGTIESGSGPVEFVAFDDVPGVPLAQRLSRGALPIERVVRHAIAMAEALDRAHRSGIVLRDLRPGSVLIGRAGPKLLPSGLGLGLRAGFEPIKGVSAISTLVPAEGQSSLEELPYLAPELLEGSEDDARTDLFAFGALVYEMASGQRAFQGSSPAKVIASLQQTDRVPLGSLRPKVPAGLERVVQACLIRDPADRWQTASDLLRELRWVADESSGERPTVPPGARLLRWRGWALPAAFALSTLLALLWFSTARAPGRRDSARFTVEPAAGTTLADTTIALSPDGRRLVFAATTMDGQRSLWIRELGSITPRPLAGTEDASYPFWAPDNRFVAFFAHGLLKKVQPDGGPVQVLCPAPEGRGGTWGREDVIVFAPNSRSGLYRVPAAGGASEPITQLEPSREEVTHRWPHFLPDGRRFLSLAWSVQQRHRGIYAGALDSRRLEKVIDAPSAVALAPGARLLYVKDRVLLSHQLDLDRLRVEGDATVVARDVWSDFTNISGLTALAAAQNGTVAYRTGGPALYRMVWYDRGGRTMHALGPEAEYFDLALAPDQTHIAASRGDDQGVADLWLLDQARPAAARLTIQPSDEYDPIWSPDGSTIVYADNRSGIEDLYRIPSSGATQGELLLRSEMPKFPESWSPDGRLLLFVVIDPQTKYDLWMLPLEGKRGAEPLVQTEFNEGSARFSPDGRWIAYTSDLSGRHEVYVQAFPISAGRVPVSTSGGSNPLWRKDGRELYYLSLEGTLMAAPVQSDGEQFLPGLPQKLFQTPIRTRNLFALYNSPRCAAAPDGERFLMMAPAGAEHEAAISLILSGAGATP